MIGANRGGGSGAALRVKRWVRDEFAAAPVTVLLVTELTCTKPNCPPLETVIALLEPGRRPEEHKLHKALAHVTRDDVIALARTRREGARDARHTKELDR